MSARDIVLSGGGSATPTYVEDVFSTYLYTGNGSNQTIVNGIDLAGKGGLVWSKYRTGGNISTAHHSLIDTVRGANANLRTSQTNAQDTSVTDLVTAFSSTGYSLGADNTTGGVNRTNATYASWTFRKQPKFFDIVTYTGNGSTYRSGITHSLGSAVGMIIVKATSTTGDWMVWHRESTNNLCLNQTLPIQTGQNSIQDVTSSEFAVFNDTTPQDWSANTNGVTYVAYLFAHNAGGFGATGTDNVISCGTYTGSSTEQTIDLGYEPQWIMIKKTSSADDWYIFDVMRGLVVCPTSATTPTGDADAALRANTSGAEQIDTWGIDPAPRGFTVRGNNVSPSGAVYFYIAIRRPMKTPTVGTQVFSPIAYVGDGTNNRSFLTGFPTDMTFWSNRNKAYYSNAAYIFDKLRGIPNIIYSNLGGEAVYTGNISIANYDNTKVNFASSASGGWNYNGLSGLLYSFRRAPGFFDIVCYTGTGVARTVAHNLGVVPELMIVKSRSSGQRCSVLFPVESKWLFWDENTANISWPPSEWYFGNGTSYTPPTSTTFTVGINNTETNASTYTYVTYLFASCPGVSKVGSYTGNGSSQTIACGFAYGARFILIKRTDSTGDWFTWDTARGIVSANDPHLSLNSTAAEVTTDDSVDPDNSGFIVNQVSATNINVTSATYIFLAIA